MHVKDKHVPRSHTRFGRPAPRQPCRCRPTGAQSICMHVSSRVWSHPRHPHTSSLTSLAPYLSAHSVIFSPRHTAVCKSAGGPGLEGRCMLAYTCLACIHNLIALRVREVEKNVHCICCAAAGFGRRANGLAFAELSLALMQGYLTDLPGYYGCGESLVC